MTNIRRLALSALTTIFALQSFGCGEEPPPPPPPKHTFNIEVQAEDSNENPLSKVPVTVDGKVVGFTDAEGKFTASLKEKAGTDVTIAVKDIDGYHFPEEETSVTETLRVTTVNGQQSGVPLFLKVTAESLRKDYFVWVRARCEKGLEEEDCSGMPVKLNGEQVGETNRFGYAHFSFQDIPQNDVEVSIETPDAAKPASPMYAMTLDLDSHVYMIDETFQDPEFTERKPRRKTRRRRTRSPRKKSSAPAKKVEKKKKKGDGVIDLW